MTYDLKLEQQDVFVIMRALGTQPLQTALGTFQKIEQQVAEQDATNAVEVKDAD